MRSDELSLASVTYVVAASLTWRSDRRSAYSPDCDPALLPGGQAIYGLEAMMPCKAGVQDLQLVLSYRDQTTSYPLCTNTSHASGRAWLVR